VRRREGLRVWFGTHRRGEMEGESKRNKGEKALVRRGLLK